jgi:hypothetical protein
VKTRTASESVEGSFVPPRQRNRVSDRPSDCPSRNRL